MKQNINFSHLLIALICAVSPAIHAMTGVTGCTGPAAQFCSISAGCVQSNIVIANSFVTPAGALVGPINYAVLSNQATVATGANVLWAATPVGNISGAITLNPATGSITLPTGLFLVEYTVRFTKTPFEGTATAVAQLQQTVASVPTNITQPAITTTTSVDGISDAIPSSNDLVSGWALVTVTGATNNAINLVVSYDGNDSLPATAGVDANAQLSIVQLR